MIDFNSVYNVTKNLTILYVEDDTNFREDTCDVLLTLFKNVDLSIDGQEGIDKYMSYYEQHKKHYDIVITDVKMPNLNGIELTKLIYEKNKKQPIIVVSAHNDSTNLLEFVNIGIQQFLVKPIDADKMLEILYKVAQDILSFEQTTLVSQVYYLNNNYTWDNEKRLLYCDKDIIKLSYKEIILMNTFIKNKDKISTYEEIFISLWQYEQHKASVQQLKPIVSNLRKKIPFQKIESVSKIGYRLVF